MKQSKNSLIILSLLILVVFSGCVAKPEIRYIDKPHEVKIPVKCKVPDANCSFDRETDTEVISSLLECIINMKQNEKVCK